MTSSAIRTIHWARVDPAAAPEWVDADAALLAIWPAPVGSDACFRKAGFTDFDVAGCEQWNGELRGVLERLVGWLERHGRVVVRQGAAPRASWWDRLRRRQPRRPAALEQLWDALCEDHLPDCIVEFGRPARVTLRIGRGRPIFWLATPKGVSLEAGGLLAHLAEGRAIRQTRLEWQFLTGGPGR